MHTEHGFPLMKNLLISIRNTAIETKRNIKGAYTKL